jgi:ATP-dependent DNA ligase
VPACTLIDGETVIADSNAHVDFGTLKGAVEHSGAHVSRSIVERPAVLIVFDILQLEGSGRRREWIRVKRHRTADCVVIGTAGDYSAPKLVLGLRRGDGQVHHLGRLEGVICHLERTRGITLQGPMLQITPSPSKFRHLAKPLYASAVYEHS